MIEKVSTNVYKIQDLTDLVTTKILTTDLKQHGDSLTEDAKAVKVMGKHEDIVQCIMDHYMLAKKKADWQFQVWWLGHGPEEDLWLPWKEAHPLAALDVYKAEHPELGL